MKKVKLRTSLTVYPCPVTLVTCQNKDHKPNIITISWTGIICSKPEMISISVKPSRFSYDIIAKSKEFVVNIPTKKHIKEMDICGTLSGRDIDKFKICKFTQSKSEVVHTPGIAECPVSIECKVKQIIPLGGHHIFISKIVAKQIDPRYCDSQGKHKPEDLDPIIYLRPKYFYLSDNTIGHFGYTLKEEK